MMRFTGAIGTSLAAFVVVPATALGPDGNDLALSSLEEALSKTVQSLEILVGIRDRAEPIAVDLVLEVTEPPIFDGPAGPERDRKLDVLRTNVSLLREELDVVEARLLSSPADTTGSIKTPVSGVTRGLDPEALDVLRKLGAPGAPVHRRSIAPATDTAYSANPLMQAQACYRAGLFARGFALLEKDETVAGRYWRARCLERLDRLTEAAELYRAISEQEDAGSFAERASTNLEFVTWKLTFVERLPEELRRREATE